MEYNAAMTMHSVLSASMIRQPRLRQTAVDRLFEPASDFDMPADEDTGRRCRIWDFAGSLHCSIVGTCLTTAEVRQILVKLKLPDATQASEHDVHTIGVALAGKRDLGGKLLQKALDRRHKAAIARFAKAKDAAGVIALWSESLAQGDIPGAYWAALTHPAATEDVIRRVFGDVHMLSHMVGAANRADIRRLRQLEDENARLTAKLERQQRQLRDGFLTRDATIRQLRDMVAQQAREHTDVPGGRAPDETAQRDAIRDLSQRLEHETARRERAERKLEVAIASRREADKLLERLAREYEVLRAELRAAEAQLAAAVQPGASDGHVALDGETILYVGGRAHQVPQFKAMVEQAGGAFLHHDGGVEQTLAALPGLISRADCVLFPVDCVSHNAVATIKRLCRQIERRFEPLRTASLACLLAALASRKAATARPLSVELRGDQG